MGHKFEVLSGKIVEAAVAVHKELGPGFLESVYQKAMKVALRHRGFVFDNQKDVHIFFEKEEVGCHRLDLIVEGTIIVEQKAVKEAEYRDVNELIDELDCPMQLNDGERRQADQRD